MRLKKTILCCLAAVCIIAPRCDAQESDGFFLGAIGRIGREVFGGGQRRDTNLIHFANDVAPVALPAGEPVELLPPTGVPESYFEVPRGSAGDNHWLLPGETINGQRPTISMRLGELGREVVTDYKYYYSWPNAFCFLGGLSVDAVLANTQLDQNFQNWYQDDVRSSTTDQWAKFWKTFGEGSYMIPAAVGLGVVGSLLDDNPIMATTGEYGWRVTRAYAVGGPPVLLMQWAIGAGRPSEGRGSQWDPFQDTHGVSGHAFIGAVPFITAAQMSDPILVKGFFYACSVMPAWSRVNDNQHYLSQVVLGWWMAYMAAASVEQTEFQKHRFHAMPVASPNFTGVMMSWEH